jgi:hypothetical protein
VKLSQKEIQLEARLFVNKFETELVYDSIITITQQRLLFYQYDLAVLRFPG